MCLKALCTTALALQYLHSIHATLFPALLHMIFDPDKKGPSEFTTRGIITSVLFTYIECAGTAERVARAHTVLGYLRDPETREEERPVSFVLEMRRDRPYRVWCKEVVNVTKEVFWIFLHHLNVVPLPSVSTSTPSDEESSDAADDAAMAPPSSSPTTNKDASACLLLPMSSATNGSGNRPDDDNTATATEEQEQQQQHYAYIARHFPQERPPVPEAPYVGGVEWDATNYVASHLDLLNALIACTGRTAAERNALRDALRISGWERCLGGSLRLCKEKFYGAVHDGLRTWVAAAAADGWDVRDVRYGPPPMPVGAASTSTSPVRKPLGGGGGGKNKNKDGEMDAAPPRIEMPRLDFAFDGDGGAAPRANEPWLI